ncbi:MAG: plasma-membrane proton-efflux P-type ATPase, partial [Cyanobacteriota bacterium]
RYSKKEVIMAENLIDVEKAKEISSEEIIKNLSTDMEKGLTEDIANQRLKEYGYNEITEKEESLLMKFLKNFWGPIPWMIEAAAILSAIIKHWEDFFIILLLLFINAAIEFVQGYKAGNALAALKERLASTSRVKRNGKWKELEARELVPGDVIRVRLGDIIPADIKLVDGDYMMIDESALTGESLPVEKHPGDVAYSGSVIKQGEMNCVVIGTAFNTFFGKTAKLVAGAKTQSHFQKAVIKIGNYLIALNFMLVAIVLVSAMFRHDPILEVIQFALVLTVASIPAAMPAVLSATMAAGALKLSKKEVIISKLVAIEEMAGMDILCSDKTGTITKNQLTITELKPIGNFNEDDILVYGSLASKAENHDPIDDAVIGKMAANETLKNRHDNCKQENFLPFDPVKKRTEAEILENGKKVKASKGAPQVILELSNNKSEIETQVNDIIEKAGVRGFRTLGVAKCDDQGTWHFVGLICLSDPPRDDSAITIETAQKLGVRVKMITGDHLAIAKETARQVRMGDNILPAKELTEKPDRQAIKLVEGADGFSQVFPEHKYEIVELLQEANHIVGMTGDGVNDAPALKKADAGIAVEGATDAAKSAADIVLTKPGLSVILDAIKESRMIFQRMQSYATYRISETIDVLFFTVLAILIFSEYPVTAIMIVMLALFNDFPIMSIAFDNVKPSEKPEIWEMRKVISIASVLGFTNVIFTFMMFYLGKHYFALPFDQVQTLVFAELAIAGNLTIFLARCRGPLWSIAPGSALVWSTLISKIIVSLICAYGFFVAPIGPYIFFVWIYACLQMLVTDRMKLLAYKVFDHEDIKFSKVTK